MCVLFRVLQKDSKTLNIYVEEGLSLFFLSLLLCFLSWLDFLLREIDARTDDDDDDDAVVVLVLRAHNAHQGPRREITSHTLEEEEEDFESTLLSWCLFSSLIIIHSRERASVEP